MAKKKKGKVVQMLSPENYIRQKARNLPIHECRINKDWKKSGLAHISVARKHTTGNITMGSYLVDLKLLGVKDAFYQFNISQLEYKELIEKLNEKLNTVVVPYTLVHNVVFAGIEYAENYGFKPHRDYTSVAQHILEEDTDDIELIEIECGENNMPVYVRGPFESETRAKQIIAQLETTAGTGNYKIVWQSDEDVYEKDPWDVDIDESDDELDDEMDELEEKFEGFSIDEKIDLILEMVNTIKKPTPDQSEKLIFLVRSIIDSYLDFNLLIDVGKKLTKKLLNYEISEEYSDELLGISPDSNSKKEKWEKQFTELLKIGYSKPKSAEKKIQKLQKEMADNPALAYLDLIISQIQESPLYGEKLDNYYQQFPRYPLMKLFWTTHYRLKDLTTNPVGFFKKGPVEFFADRRSIHHIELFHYLSLLIIISSAANNITLLEVVDKILYEIEIPEEEEENLSEMITISRMKFILSLKEEATTTEKGKSSTKKWNQMEAENFQFKIQIQEIAKPPVWRRVTIPSNYSFYDFHYIIQTVFGWTNSHLFQFSEKGFASRKIITEIYEDLDPGDNEQMEAKDVKLSEIFKKEKQKFIYIYDFGDSWEHTITLEKIVPEKTIYPVLIDGKGKCPPEDCGGIYGYENFKKIMANRRHPEYEEYAEWCELEDGEKWDPNEFDLKQMQSLLKNLSSDS